MTLVITTAVGILAALAVVAQVAVAPMVRSGRQPRGRCAPLVAPRGSGFGDATAIKAVCAPDPVAPAAAARRTPSARPTGLRGHGLGGRPAHV